MDATRLIEFVIGLDRLFIEILGMQEKEHQDIRLLDHVVTVDPIIRPMRIKREVGHRDRVNIDMREIVIALVLFKEFGLRVKEDQRF